MNRLFLFLLFLLQGTMAALSQSVSHTAWADTLKEVVVAARAIREVIPAQSLSGKQPDG